ncbi:hypothetical protein B0J14DRAFT_570891 [Halenospora varia]|nr:hypothetical protein B0J14DRAFT_570891 [Halenospora varia]
MGSGFHNERGTIGFSRELLSKRLFRNGSDLGVLLPLPENATATEWLTNATREPGRMSLEFSGSSGRSYESASSGHHPSMKLVLCLTSTISAFGTVTMQSWNRK